MITVTTTKQWLYVEVDGAQLYFNRGEIASKGMLSVIESVGKAVTDNCTKDALRQLWMAVKRNPAWWSADAITRRDYEWRIADMLATTKKYGGTFASEKQASFYKEMKAWLAEHSQAA